MRVIIRYSKNINFTDILNDYPEMNVVEHFNIIRVFVIKVSFDIEIGESGEEEESQASIGVAKDLVARLKDDDRITSVNRDKKLYSNMADVTETTDTSGSGNYYYHLENMSKRNPKVTSSLDHQYSYTQDGTNVDIYILDSGISYDHPYLNGSSDGSNYDTRRAIPLPDDLHGATGITGIKITNPGQNYFGGGAYVTTMTFPDPSSPVHSDSTDAANYIADLSVPQADRRAATADVIISGAVYGPIADIVITDFGNGYDVTKKALISNLITITGAQGFGTGATVSVTSLGNEHDALYGTGHGTVVALVAAGYNPLAATGNYDYGPGVARKANIYSIKCSDWQGVASESRVLKGIEAIIKHNASQINNSGTWEVNPDYKNTGNPSIVNVSYTHIAPNVESKRYYEDIFGENLGGDQTDAINDILKEITTSSSVNQWQSDPIHVVLAAGNGYLEGANPQATDTSYGPMDAIWNLAEISLPAGGNIDLGQGNPIAVSSTKEASSASLDPWTYANYGEAVTIWAPGHEIYYPNWDLVGPPPGTSPTVYYTEASGTSLSAAIVTGLLALRLQGNRAETPANTKVWLTTDGRTDEIVTKLMTEAALLENPLECYDERQWMDVTWNDHPLVEGDIVQISGLFFTPASAPPPENIKGWREVLEPVTVNAFRIHHDATTSTGYPLAASFGGTGVRIAKIADATVVSEAKHEYSDGVVFRGDEDSIKLYSGSSSHPSIEYLPVTYSTKAYIFNPYQVYTISWKEDADLGTYIGKYTPDNLPSGFLDIGAKLNTKTEPTGYTDPDGVFHTEGPYTVTHAVSGLPAGLTLTQDGNSYKLTGELVADPGNPTQTFTVQATNNYDTLTVNQQQQAFSVTINQCEIPGVTSGIDFGFNVTDPSISVDEAGYDCATGCSDELYIKINLDWLSANPNCQYQWAWYVDGVTRASWQSAESYSPPASICVPIKHIDLSSIGNDNTDADLQDCGLISCYNIQLKAFEVGAVVAAGQSVGDSSVKSLQINNNGAFNVEYAGTDYHTQTGNPASAEAIENKCTTGCADVDLFCCLTLEPSSTKPGQGGTPGDSSNACTPAQEELDNPSKLFWVYVLQTYDSTISAPEKGRFRIHSTGSSVTPPTIENTCFPDDTGSPWTASVKRSITLLGLDPCIEADFNTELSSHDDCNLMDLGGFFIQSKIVNNTWKVYSSCMWVDEDGWNSIGGYEGFDADGCSVPCSPMPDSEDVTFSLILNFNDDGTGTIYDTSQYSNLVTNSQASTIPPLTDLSTSSTSHHKLGNAAAHFAAADSFINVSTTDTSMELDGAFTIDFWARFDAIISTQTLFSSYNVDHPDLPNAGKGLELLWAGSNTFKLKIQENEVTSQVVFQKPVVVANPNYVSTLAPDRFFHIALVRDGGNYFNLYINGVQYTKDQTQTYVIGFRHVDDKFYIGKSQTLSAQNHFDGYMDEFRIAKQAIWTAGFGIESTCFGVPIEESNACSGGDENVDSCGNNNSGIKTQTCSNGTWVDWNTVPCEGEDECVYNDIDIPTCSEQSEVCNASSGLWETGGYLLGPDTFFEGFLIAGAGAGDDSGGKIGPTPDTINGYADGLLDLDANTSVGEAVDGLNEELKRIDELTKTLLNLAPAEAPAANNLQQGSAPNGEKVYLSATTNSSWANSQVLGTDDSTWTPPGQFSFRGVGSLFEDDNSGTYPPANPSYYPNNLEYDRRLGVYAKSQITSITFTINGNVPGAGSNYPNDSFGKADQGKLHLYLNGTQLSGELDLSSTESQINQSVGNSSTISVGALQSAHFASGASFDSYKHRYASTVTIDIADMALTGWYYAQIRQVIDTNTTIYSNYITWIIDDNEASIQVTPDTNVHPRVTEGAQFSYLSGIKYLKSPFSTPSSVEFKYDIDNVYKNFYYYNDPSDASSNEGMSWSGTGLSLPSSEDLTPPPSQNYTISRTQDCPLTTPYCYEPSSWRLGKTVSMSITVKHPNDNLLPSNLWTPCSGESVGTINDTFLIYDSDGIYCDTTESEYFTTERYRLRDHSVFTGGSTEPFPTTPSIYVTQQDVENEINRTNGAGWNKATDLSTASTNGHVGLMCFNGGLCSPKNTADANGDSGITNGDFSGVSYPTFSSGANVDYSNISPSLVRYFYRAFKNDGYGDKTEFQITITEKNIGTSYPNNYTQIVNYTTPGTPGASYSANNITVEIKVPGITSLGGWLDCAVKADGTYANGKGIAKLLPNLTSSGDHHIAPGNSAQFVCTLGTGSVLNNNYIVMRIGATGSWINALEKIEVKWENY